MRVFNGKKILKCDLHTCICYFPHNEICKIDILHIRNPPPNSSLYNCETCGGYCSSIWLLKYC